MNKAGSLLVFLPLNWIETDGLQVGFQVGIVSLVASGHLRSGCVKCLPLKTTWAKFRGCCEHYFDDYNSCDHVSFVF